jgi:sulfonate transport system substrate-binding protein
MPELPRRLALAAFILLFFAVIGFNVAVAENSPKEFRIGVGKDGLLVMVRQQGILEKKLAERGVTVRWIECRQPRLWLCRGCTADFRTGRRH